MVTTITVTKHPAGITTTKRTPSSRVCSSASKHRPNPMRAVAIRGTILLVALGAALFSACDRDDQQIKVYRVSKAPLESTPPPLDATMPTNVSSPAADAVAPPPSSDKPQIQWDRS